MSEKQQPEAEKVPFCCHIPCDKDAEWVMMYTPFGLDEYTHSCSGHLGDMMTDGYEHRIYHVGCGA